MLWANERVAEASTIAVAVTSVLKVMGSISRSGCPENPPAGFWFGRDVMRRIRKQQTEPAPKRERLVFQAGLLQSQKKAGPDRRIREHGVVHHVIGGEIGLERERMRERFPGFIDPSEQSQRDGHQAPCPGMVGMP